jgi:hypothetical protein
MPAAMLATYASFLAGLACSALVGQAVLVLCGHREWSPLAPAVGLAGLLALAWATVRLPGEGTAAAVAIGAATVASLAIVRGRVGLERAEIRVAAAIALAAALAASLPFAVEGRFGILGTGLNPDMSQHLFAADRLASGGSERLIEQGYPLGPHSLVVALADIGPGLVQAFDGLMLVIVSITALTAAGLLRESPAWARIASAVLVGFAYLLASNYVQGAFKESLEALFVLAFAIGLGEVARGWTRSDPRPRVLRGVPLAVLAIGAVYCYSFPGLAWIAGALGLWALIELARAARRGALRQAVRLAWLAAPAALLAVGVVTLATLPELGRMLDFADFETFDPDGEGLGNLFDRISPLEALGIWPSGDFRVEPGDGAAPAAVFYLGAALGLGALGFGLAWWWRRGDRAVPAALAAAAVLWLYALAAGTPYQEAKALVIAAPLVGLISARALAAGAPMLAALVFVAAAGGSSALALVNGPVGPRGYSPELRELAGQLPGGSTFVTAPAELLDEQHGRDYLVWELRGNRICVEEEGAAPPDGVVAELAVTLDDDGAVVPEGAYSNRSPGTGSELGPCPFISETGRADPAGDD